jgi:transcription initiation factor TFIIB
MSIIKTRSLGLPAMIQRCSLYIGRKAVELGIVPGCSAISVAAASIYMASNASDKKLTKKEIGDVTGVDDVIIRQSYELMYPRATELFPVDFELDINKLPKS